MSEAKFTKGPWNAKDGMWIDGCYITSSSRIGMVKICSVDSAYLDGHANDSFESEQLANAHLIAAAPELYDMLASIENDAGEIPKDFWDKIQATLAKARGE